jgi:hypothetical protein
MQLQPLSKDRQNNRRLTGNGEREDVGDVNVQDLMNEVDSGATGNFKESLSGFHSGSLANLRAALFAQATVTRINLINVHCVQGLHCSPTAFFKVSVHFSNVSEL